MLVVCISSDILYPVHQQLEIVEALRQAGKTVPKVERDKPHGHDGFLNDFHNMEPPLEAFVAAVSDGSSGILAPSAAF